MNPLTIISRIREDLKNAREHDPAARGDLENAIVYSGLHAIWSHRVCHWLWKRNIKGPARILSQLNRFFTGIEINHGANIRSRFFFVIGMGNILCENSYIGV